MASSKPKPGKSLAETHPDVAAQADGWDPTTVKAGSNKKHRWICGNGHSWVTSVLSRTQGGRRNLGTGCAVCNGRKLLRGFNDLKTVNPDLASEALDWDPGDYLRGSRARKNWKCSKDHIWSQSIVERACNGSGCPVCKGKVVDVGVNDLATLFPEIAAQADGWNPQTVFAQSNKKVKWRCGKGHGWLGAVSNRTVGGNGCPICSGQTVLAGFNDLATTHPKIAAEAIGWDPKKVIAGTNVKYDWQCGTGHLWKASPHNRALNGRGCPYCSNYKVLVGYNDLKTLDPELSSEAFGWDPTKVTVGNNTKRRWVCKYGHVWSAVVNSRSVRKLGCPVCSGQTVLAGFNDLATTHPEIASQASGWDSTSVTAGSNTKRRWICEQGHSWVTMVNSRTAGRGCPTCAKYGFDPNSDGWLYLVQSDEKDMYQIGISNQPKIRLAQHLRKEWNLEDLRGPMDGHLTQKLETDCLHALEKRGAILGHKAGVDKFDGYTEAWTKKSLNVTSIKQILDWVYEDESLLTLSAD